MDKHDLNATLTRLHEELKQGQQLDEESRERLQVLLDDIRDALKRDPSSSSDTEEDSLGDRLQDAVVEFEAAYPQFSQLIGRIADGLSNLGI